MTANLSQPMRFRADLESGLVTTPQRTHLNYGDVNANRIVVEVMEGGAQADLTGMIATGSFYRPGDAAQIALEGEVSGNEASVMLIDHCYAAEGTYEAEVKLTAGGVTRTILSITGYVHRAGSGAVVDVSGVIPSLDALLAQIQATKDAAAAANGAAGEANSAAENANEQAEAAKKAAQEAEEAADGASAWANASMTAEALPAGSEPTADVSKNEAGNYVIALGIPKGDTGATPQITVEVTTGAAGTDAAVSVSGTAENPVIHLTIPRGDTGAIDGVDYYEGNPAALGEASPGAANGLARGDHVHPMPTASDVGALGVEDKAADSDRLGGVEASQYATHDDVDEAIGNVKIGVAGAAEGDLPVFDANGDLVSSGKSLYAFTRALMTLSGTTLTITTVE